MTYAQNKKARFNYEIIEIFEAGIVLTGGEVKSVRDSTISLKESYVKIKNNELFLTQAHVSVPTYIPSYAVFDEVQDRKLLMHKREILKLKNKLKEQGLTLIVLSIYQREGTKKIKVQLALARGKKLYNKKQTIKERDIKRDMERTLKKF